MARAIMIFNHMRLKLDGYADGAIANNGNIGQGSDQQSYNFW